MKITLKEVNWLKNLKIIVVFLILLQAPILSAQNYSSQILGITKNQSDKIVGNATIQIKGTQLGTSSNDQGRFSIAVPSGKITVIVSSIGYKSLEKTVILKTDETVSLTFELKKNLEDLDEVIINAQVAKEKVAISSGSATKSNISLMNTPAPIVVVAGYLLDQQANSTIQESIRNVSGVTQAGNNYNIGDNLIIRGLDANYAYDGMYGGGSLGNTFNPVRSQTNIEKIEVLKGPSTGLYGMGAAGGIINLIEKKPLDFEQYTLESRFGNWGHYRIMADLTGPLAKNLSYRLVSASESEEGYRDISSQRFETYGTLRYTTKKQELTVSSAYIEDAVQIDATGNPVRLITPNVLGDPNAGGYSWENLQNDPTLDKNGNFTGLQLSDDQRKTLANSLLNSDGTEPFDIGDATLVSPLSTPNEGVESRIKLRHEWKPSAAWTITNQFLYRNYKSNYVRQTGALNYVYWATSGVINDDPRAPLVENDVLYPYAARRQEYRIVDAKEKMFQYFGDFKNTWGAENKFHGEHMLSINFENRDINFTQYNTWDADDSRATNPVPYIYDIRNPNWGSGSIWDYNPILGTQYEKKVKAWGTGLQEVLYYDKFTARMGGAFLGTIQNYQDIYALGPYVDFDDSGFAYNFGLNYRPIDQLSLFANYAAGRTVYAVTSSLDGDDRPDSESLSIDFGLRYKSLKNDFLASVVFFQTATTNLQYSNDDYDDDPGSSAYNISVPEYFYDQENRTRGVEIDINYAATNLLSFNANATFQDPKTLEASTVTNEQSTGVPKTYARLWSQYKILIGKNRNVMSLNFGVNYESERSITGYGLNAHVDEYVIYDTALGYNLSKNWNLKLNVANLFNTRYYIKAMYAGGLPGETRNFQGTVKYTF
ncbi:TonB-dependent receptor [Flavobacterium algicola]|uniref:TonB-dependent receptor n=1 Tax=Flavobacterium algicola TaxID=556529 RepID=UPI001EFD28DD|nr:TonB-dependent receptor [Flavobacterium algicola]MCG9791754.1 TonB-dependent receptor [Flavobacterium algicola]